MQCFERLKRLVIGVGVLVVVASAQSAPPATRSTSRPATRPTTSPTSRPATPDRTRKPDPLRLAIADLQREAQAALQQHKAFPREASNYFPAENEIDAAALLNVLGSRIHQNPRIDAYVKYQLLSAVKSFEGDLALPAMKAYVLGSPPMIALPGVSQQEQQKWNQKAVTAKKDDLEKINQEWTAALAPYVEANAIIEAYRDLMKSRIQPPEQLKHKFFQACLEDLSQRGASGVEVDKPLTALSKNIVAWSSLATREQINDMLAGLKEYTLRRPPKMLEKLTWGKSDKAYWTTHDAGLSQTKIEKLREQLETALKNAVE